MGHFQPVGFDQKGIDGDGHQHQGRGHRADCPESPFSPKEDPGAGHEDRAVEEESPCKHLEKAELAAAEPSGATDAHHGVEGPHRQAPSNGSPPVEKRESCQIGGRHQQIVEKNHGQWALGNWE